MISFDFDDLLLLARLSRLLLRLVLVFAVVQNLANRRGRIRSYLDQIEPRFLRPLQGDLDLDGAMIVAILVDQLNTVGADLLVDARPILGSRLRRFHGATNGSVLLCRCDGPAGAGEQKISTNQA